MRKKLSFMVAAIISVGLVLTGAVSTYAADSTVSVPIEVTYGQSEARDMLELLNTYRTSDTWQWNADEKREEITGRSALAYDYGLEQVAMQRAAEIALSFSHTRPNGESCFTAYTSENISGSRGENIAAGQKSAASVFEAWWEEDESYDGQGHRRNILNEDYRVIGIGHVTYMGIDYWVQEFGSSPSGRSDPGVCNENRQVSIDVTESNIQAFGVSDDIQSGGSLSDLKLKVGESVNLSNLYVYMDISGHLSWFNKHCLLSTPVTAETLDGSIAVCQNGSIVGVSAGTTTLKISVLDRVYSVNLTVESVGREESADQDTEQVTDTQKVTETKTPTAAQLKKSVALTTSSKTLKKGKSYKIKFQSKLKTEYVSKITYTSSDKKIATVSKNGKVTAKKKGSATVKCKVTFTDGTTKTVKLKIKVKNK